jgi:hypothetical protein
VTEITKERPYCSRVATSPRLERALLKDNGRGGSEAAREAVERAQQGTETEKCNLDSIFRRNSPHSSNLLLGILGAVGPT